MRTAAFSCCVLWITLRPDVSWRCTDRRSKPPRRSGRADRPMSGRPPYPTTQEPVAKERAERKRWTKSCPGSGPLLADVRRHEDDRRNAQDRLFPYPGLVRCHTGDHRRKAFGRDRCVRRRRGGHAEGGGNSHGHDRDGQLLDPVRLRCPRPQGQSASGRSPCHVDHCEPQVSTCRQLPLNTLPTNEMAVRGASRDQGSARSA